MFIFACNFHTTRGRDSILPRPLFLGGPTTVICELGMMSFLFLLPLFAVIQPCQTTTPVDACNADQTGAPFKRGRD